MISLNTPATIEVPGDNVIDTVSITFPVYEVENIEAVVTDPLGVSTTLALTTDYLLSSDVGIPNSTPVLTLVDNGKPYLNAGKLKIGYTLFVKFTTKAFQPAKFRELGRFSPDVFEKTLDRLTMNMKAIKDVADRALQLEIGSGGTGLIPPLAGNANKTLVVNPTGNAFTFGPTVNDIQGFKDDAQTAATDAANSATAANLSAIAADNAADAAALDAAAALSNKNLAVTAKDDAQTAAAGAAASELAAIASATSAQVEANNAAASAADAAASALAASTAEGFKIQAEAAALAADASADAAALSALDSQTFANNSAASAAASQTSANASAASALEAEDHADTALLYAIESENSANDSAVFADRLLWDSIKEISFADSPYNVDPILDRDVMISVDDSGGPVTINLPPIASTDLNWEIGIFKALNTPNVIQVISNAPNTINSSTFININNDPFGAVIYAGSPTNWLAKFFLASVSTAFGSRLPPGGVKGNALIKQSNIDGDALWKPDPSIVNALIFG